jgi:hypothetical protein
VGCRSAKGSQHYLPSRTVVVCTRAGLAHRIALIGVRQTAVQILDSRTTALYPDAHGCLLLVGCLACVLGEIYPYAHDSQPGISNSFSEDL